MFGEVSASSTSRSRAAVGSESATRTPPNNHNHKRRVGLFIGPDTHPDVGSNLFLDLDVGLVMQVRAIATVPPHHAHHSLNCFFGSFSSTLPVYRTVQRQLLQETRSKVSLWCCAIKAATSRFSFTTKYFPRLFLTKCSTQKSLSMKRHRSR